MGICDAVSFRTMVNLLEKELASIDDTESAGVASANSGVRKRNWLQALLGRLQRIGFSTGNEAQRELVKRVEDDLRLQQAISFTLTSPGGTQTNLP